MFIECSFLYVNCSFCYYCCCVFSRTCSSSLLKLLYMFLLSALCFFCLLALTLLIIPDQFFFLFSKQFQRDHEMSFLIGLSAVIGLLGQNIPSVKVAIQPYNLCISQFDVATNFGCQSVISSFLHFHLLNFNFILSNVAHWQSI